MRSPAPLAPLLAILFSVASASSVAAQTPPRTVDTPQGTIELIVGAAGPDRERRIPAGLRFQLKDGWHIYWKNPGDSGGPPTIRGIAPFAVTAGPFEWPTPERIPYGPLINYGYHGTITLPFTLRLAPGTSLPQHVVADVRWLVCKDVCVSVRSQLSIDLPFSRQNGDQIPEWQTEIRRARDRVPQTAPRTWHAAATFDGDTFVITVDVDRTASSAVFFPLTESQIDDSAPQKVAIRGRNLTIRLKRSQQLTGIPDTVPGVLSLDGGPGYTISPRVTGRASSNRRSQ
jgi:DsbC/DsbD-like thiol-disulfide interchange protein